MKIIPAGKRSQNSKPSFRRRNRKGLQIYTSLPAAVYGAFVLSELPRYRLKHIDGNPNNCHIDNLSIADGSILRKNIELLAPVYLQNYKRLCKRLMAFKQMTLEETQDYASDAFIEMCQSLKPINISKAPGLWMFLAKRKIVMSNMQNRIEYDVYHTFQNMRADEGADEEVMYKSIINLLPKRCQVAVSLILSGYTQSEAAQKMCCTKSWVCALLKKSKSILNSYDQQRH